MMNPEDHRKRRRNLYAWQLLIAALPEVGCHRDDADSVKTAAPVANVAALASAAPAQERGRQIYRAGKSASGRPIRARYGEPPVEVAAAVLVCENCHGEDGLGRPEGGIQPSDISWEALSKPYGVTTPRNRGRPPYTEQTLRRAITLGFDSGGAALGADMPRYVLSRDDLDDLVAYLKTLGTARDPGVTDDAIWIGVFLPAASEPPSAGEPLRGALSAFFEQINEQGGIYGRRVELRWATAAARREDRAPAFRAFLDGAPVFALVSPFAVGLEEEVTAEASQRKLPFIGPLVPSPRLDLPENRYVFYLDAGIEGQVRALIRFAAKLHARDLPPAAILRAEGPRFLSVVEAVHDECRRAGWRRWAELTFRSESADLEQLAARTKASGSSVVLAIGLGDQIGPLIDAAAAGGWAPELLLPGSLVGRNVFDAHPRFGGRIVVALPSLPTDQTQAAAEEYGQLSKRGSLSSRDRGTHWSALAAARLLVEALRRSGRNTSRERVVSVLESLREFHTGYSPPLTFGPRRRVGAWGAYLLDVVPSTGKPTLIGSWQDAAPAQDQ
jgi:ABC-type branched-subunit amino acid transport system substrate-binding protein